MSNVDEEVIKKIFLSLNTTKAAGKFPAKFVRDSADVLALSLGNITNLSIKLLAFPEECKIAKSKPIYSKKEQGLTLKTTDLLHFCH